MRVLDGSEVIAEHGRVYGKGEQIEHPAHIDALVSAKHAARHHRGQDRLAHAAPMSRELLQQAAQRGTPLARATAQLVQLLDDYGAAELEHAIAEALKNDVPHPNGVRQVLERRREQRNRLSLLRNRHADLLFNIINRRYELKPTLVTTNRPFAEWSEVFPNAACVVSIVDRLVHHSEILVIEAESYRMREAKERAARKKKAVKPPRATTKHPAPQQLA